MLGDMIYYLINVFLDVPVSSQWKSNGHLYPIQIAQFGLSHWSRLELSSQNDIYKFEQIQPSNVIHLFLFRHLFFSI